MVVEYDEGVLNDAAIISAVEKGGYGAFVAGANKREDGTEAYKKNSDSVRLRLILSVIFLIVLMYVSMGHMIGLPLPGFLTGTQNAISFAFTQFLLTLPILYYNRKYFIGGFRSLVHRAPNMDTLIAVGSGAAVIYGIIAIYEIGIGLAQQDMQRVMSWQHDLYFEAAAMILTLVTVGKYMESRSKSKTSEAIEKLVQLAPKTARVETENGEVIRETSSLLPGDVIIVKAGETVAVDGEIIEGSGAVDESVITGESIPVEKNQGSRVIGGTVNTTGYFKFRADKVGEDTVLSQIVKLVEEAASSKAPISRIADRVSGVFVPIVMLISAVSLIAWLIAGKGFSFALSIAISVLVISCPCALGLATPTAIMVGTGVGAKNGILIKSAESLELTHTVKTVVLDKTGTVTEGKPVVTDVIGDDDLLTLAGAIERMSEHPLAQAITEAAAGRDFPAVESFHQYPGRGISGMIDGREILAGNVKMMEENHIKINRSLTDKLADEGKTPLFFGSEGKMLGIIAVADPMKPSSKEAVEGFKRLGIDVVMLTGDNRRTAEAIQKQAGIDRVISDVLPDEKEAHIVEFQENGNVAMIGDGVNDAPALMRADVGIAIGAGTDIAVDSADIVLMRSDLRDAVTAVMLSRAVIRNIKQNLFWALFYNSLGIPLAAGLFYSLWGLKLNPMIGAAAMSLSSVFVVSNALRLRFFKGFSGAEPGNKEIAGKAIKRRRIKKL